MIALIPLRGGSKGIPNKNITMVAGYPLFYWAINAAFRSKMFDDVWVSTESTVIKKMVQKYFPAIKVHDRPPELATDEISTEDVMLDFVKSVASDVLCLIQATSPLLEADDLIQARCTMIESKADSVFSVVNCKDFVWHNEQPYDPTKRPRRQDIDGYKVENGAYYFVKTDEFKKYRARICGKQVCFFMKDSLEIDEPDDLIIAEALLNNRKEIKALFFDVDGTMTDGGMYYSKSGEELKKFNTRDALGLNKLRRKMIVHAITGEKSEATMARLEKLWIPWTVSDNKVETLHSICHAVNLSLHEIAYIGDDDNDLGIMELVGLTATPNDSMIDADIVLERNGGDGAVREFCEILLEPSKME